MRAGWRPGTDWERLVRQWYETGRRDGRAQWPRQQLVGVAPDLARAYRDGYVAGLAEADAAS